jgi:hypothetical protein
MTREEDMRETATQEEFSADAEAEARWLLTAAFETAPVQPGLVADLATAAGRNGAAGPWSDVVALVRRRAARQRRARVLVPAGAVALAAAVAGGVTASAVTGAGSAAAPSARAILTAALAKTSAQSFTFKATSVDHLTEVKPRGTSTTLPESITGVFDPVSGTGAETIHFPFPQQPVVAIRFIGKFEYAKGMTEIQQTGVHKPWVKFRVPPTPSGEAPFLSAASGFVNNQPLNPADLMALLKSATVTQEGPVSGNGWTGTKYGFTATDVVPVARQIGGPNQKSRTVSVPISGTVSVDSSGRVRELATVTGLSPLGIDANAAAYVTFGDFGTPVTVTAPPASQVYDAGNASYIFMYDGGA